MKMLHSWTPSLYPQPPSSTKCNALGQRAGGLSDTDIAAGFLSDLAQVTFLLPLHLQKCDLASEQKQKEKIERLMSKSRVYAPPSNAAREVHVHLGPWNGECFVETPSILKSVQKRSSRSVRADLQLLPDDWNATTEQSIFLFSTLAIWCKNDLNRFKLWYFSPLMLFLLMPPIMCEILLQN